MPFLTHLRALCLKRSKAVEPREYGDPYLAELARKALNPWDAEETLLTNERK